MCGPSFFAFADGFDDEEFAEIFGGHVEVCRELLDGHADGDILVGLAHVVPSGEGNIGLFQAVGDAASGGHALFEFIPIEFNAQGWVGECFFCHWAS